MGETYKISKSGYTIHIINKIRSKNNLVVGDLAKFEIAISKTEGGDSFPVNFYSFNKYWQHHKFS